MLKHALKFARFKILSTCFMIVLLGSVSTGQITLKSFLAIFVLIAWYIHASSSNDYADRKIDAINLRGSKDRPLVTGSLSYRSLWVIHLTAGVFALLFSIYYGLQAVILTLVILLFSYLYSFKPVQISARGVVSQLLLPVSYVFYPFTLGYWSVPANNPYPWLLMAGLYAGFVGRLFLKDFRDIKGDRKFGKRTFLVRHGRKITCVAAGLFGFTSLVLLSFSISFSAGTLLILLIGHAAVLWLLMRLIKAQKIHQQMQLTAVIAKIANGSVVTLLIYYLSRNYIGEGSVWVLLLPAIVGGTILYIRMKEYWHDPKTQLA